MTARNGMHVVRTDQRPDPAPNWVAEIARAAVLITILVLVDQHIDPATPGHQAAALLIAALASARIALAPLPAGLRGRGRDALAGWRGAPGSPRPPLEPS
ncbi:hypothetical protein [Nocardia sp. NPDC050435]|uniref:hypothetical protein n=1 Tax=Nocardia sp. NPDC050435 TaxID=3155040 RepID=UPI00340AE609